MISAQNCWNISHHILNVPLSYIIKLVALPVYYYKNNLALTLIEYEYQIKITKYLICGENVSVCLCTN